MVYSIACARCPRADAYGFADGLRRLPALHLPHDPLSTKWRQPGILVHVHPVLPRIAEASQLQLPRPGPDGQPNETSGGGRLLNQSASPLEFLYFVSATNTPVQSGGGALSRNAAMRVRYKSNSPVRPKLFSLDRHNSTASNAPSQSRLR
jgi:hypothetical protein